MPVLMGNEWRRSSMTVGAPGSGSDRINLGRLDPFNVDISAFLTVAERLIVRLIAIITIF